MASTRPKAYTLKAADKPLHEQFKRLFSDQRVYAWSVHSHDEWFIYPDESAWDERQNRPPIPFAEAQAFLRLVDPEGCPVSRPRRSTAQLVSMVERLAKACGDAKLVAEAERLVAA